MYNKRPKQEGATWWKRCSSRMFYWTYGILSDFPLEEYTTDYRLLDRKLVEIFKKFGERNRMYRGLTDWMGFKKRALVFDSKKRLDGGSATYGYKALYHLAVNSLTSFSVFPLRLVGYLGFLMTFLSVALFLFVIIDKFTVDQFNFSNIAAILLVNTTLIGVVLMGMGLMALYIARIHEEVQ